MRHLKQVLFSLSPCFSDIFQLMFPAVSCLILLKKQFLWDTRALFVRCAEEQELLL